MGEWLAVFKLAEFVFIPLMIEPQFTAQATELNAKEISITAGKANINGKVSRGDGYSSGKSGKVGTVNVRDERSGTSENYQATHIKADKLNINIINQLNINGAEIQAKSSQINGGGVHLGSEKTVVANKSSKFQSKGAWYRNELDSNRTENYSPYDYRKRQSQYSCHKR